MIGFKISSVCRAAIDTTETGDFTKATVLSPYIYDHQYGRFGEDGTIIPPKTKSCYIVKLLCCI